MNLISKIGLGTVQFGLDYGISNNSGKTAINEVEKILISAAEKGVEIIDTARAYGDSEIVLGKCQISDRFKVISKFMPSELEGEIRNQFAKSCLDLKVDRLYGYLAHRPTALLENNRDWKTITELKSEGKIKKIGFSLNTPEELEDLLNKDMFPDLIQVPYNYFDRRFEDWMINLKKQGCEIHTRSSFLQGLFFVHYDKLDTYFVEVKENIQDLQLRFQSELSSVLLKYVLTKPFIDAAIMGVESEQQLIENIKGLQNASVLEDLEKEIPDSILMPSNWPKK